LPIRRIASSKSWESGDLKLINLLRKKFTYAHSIIKLTRILLSTLHAWKLDKNLDELFINKLDLFFPKMKVSFGHISRHHHITIMFPKKIEQSIQLDTVPHFTSKEHWSISRSLTTIHLLTILSIANSFMHLQNFIDLQFRTELVFYFKLFVYFFFKYIFNFCFSSDAIDSILGECTSLTGELNQKVNLGEQQVHFCLFFKNIFLNKFISRL